jgi:hypothetical protein
VPERGSRSRLLPIGAQIESPVGLHASRIHSPCVADRHSGWQLLRCSPNNQSFGASLFLARNKCFVTFALATQGSELNPARIACFELGDRLRNLASEISANAHNVSVIDN